MSETIQIDQTAEEFRANPYLMYAQLRKSDPVYQMETDEQRGSSSWLITRYEDAEKLLRDPRLVKNIQTLLTPEQLEQRQLNPDVAIMDQINSHMLSSDPPKHTRLRSLVNKAFTPAMIEQWRGRIQEITDELLDVVQDTGEMELISDFAYPIPMTVIAEMLGIPEEDRNQFRAWSNTFLANIGSPENFGQTMEAMSNFARYLFGFVVQRKAQPTGDLVSRLIEAESEGDKLSENELVSMIFLLLIAGHETTVNLIGNGTLALLQHPEQKALLQERPELIRSAIEELLRYNGPLFTSTIRWAREDFEFDGKRIKRGDVVIIGLSSANHDQDEFAEAAEGVDITRQENKHLAFGKGIHYCLGAPLARLEGQIAIGTLLRRMPNVRLKVDESDLKWRPGTLIHGLEALPVIF